MKLNDYALFFEDGGVVCFRVVGIDFVDVCTFFLLESTICFRADLFVNFLVVSGVLARSGSPASQLRLCL